MRNFYLITLSPILMLVFNNCLVKSKNGNKIESVITDTEADYAIPPGYNGGVIQLNAEDQEEFRKTHKRIGEVKLNILGAERSKEYQKVQAQNLNLNLDITPTNYVDFGQETIADTEDTSNLNLVDEAIAKLLPDSVDNSVLPSFPPISQQWYNSCVGFATAYYQATHNTALVRKYAINSEPLKIFSPKFIYNQGNEGEDSGSAFEYAYRILQSEGVVSFNTFHFDPKKLGVDYREWPLTEELWTEAINNRTDKAEYIENTGGKETITKIKTLLADGYLITFSTAIGSWNYQLIKKNPAENAINTHVGEKIMTWVNGTLGLHAMTIVGYDENIWTDVNLNNLVEEGEKGAFRIANSWGKNWGKNGFVWVAYDALGIASRVNPAPDQPARRSGFDRSLYHLPIKSDYSPKLLAYLTANSLNRKDAPMTFGITDLQQEFKQSVFQPFMLHGIWGIFGAAGGPYAYNGTKTAVDSKFVVDLSDLVPNQKISKIIWLKLNSLSEELTIKNFSLVGTNGKTTEVTGLPITVSKGQTKYLSTSYDFEPTPIPTASPSPSPTPVPTESPTPSPKPTVSPAPAPTLSPKPTASPALAPTLSPKPTASPAPVPTPSPKPTGSPAPVPTPSPKPTVSPAPVPIPITPTPIPGDGFEDIGSISNGGYSNYCMGYGDVAVLGNTPAVWAEPCKSGNRQIVQFNSSTGQLRFKSLPKLCFATVKGNFARTYLIDCNKQDSTYYQIYKLDVIYKRIKHANSSGNYNYCLGYRYDWPTAYYLLKGEYDCESFKNNSEYSWSWTYFSN